jgi:hypothetical protein
MPTNNQDKGNFAEYYICYSIQKRGISIWQLGGNNRRWDVLIQKNDNYFIPAQVKLRTQKAVVYKREDLNKSTGLYFIIYDPSSSDYKSAKTLVRFLEKTTERKIGLKLQSIVLVFDSKRVMDMCIRAKDRKSNAGKPTITTHMTNEDIEYGIDYMQKFWRNILKGKQSKVLEED